MTVKGRRTTLLKMAAVYQLKICGVEQEDKFNPSTAYSKVLMLNGSETSTGMGGSR